MTSIATLIPTGVTLLPPVVDGNEEILIQLWAELVVQLLIQHEQHQTTLQSPPTDQYEEGTRR